MMTAIQTLCRAASRGLCPPPVMTISDWSDKFRELPSASSSEPGRWRTSRFPFLKEIMDHLSPQSDTQEIAVMKGAQVGFTETAINLLMYTIDYNPLPALYVQKTVDAVEKFSKQRFQKSIELCPRVYAKVGDTKSRDSSNTILIKNFPGGIVILGGANSASSLRSMPIALLVLDELDSFEEDIQDEGSPSELARRRTANFPRRKIFNLSTPKIKETSKIEPLFEEGDQRYYYVPCPFCKHKQIIRWGNIVYKDDDGHDDLNHIYLKCENCQGKIYERYKTEMLEKGEWIPENPDAEMPSYHISALYSPLGFYSWKDAVKLWLKAQRNFDKELLKVFINTVLGETFSEAGKSIESSGLEQRKEEYPAEVPRDALVLTAGADVQDDRIECEIVGWGIGWENWSIDYAVFMGDTARDFVWEQLDQYLLTTWLHETDTRMRPVVSCIDSGYRANKVYQFCKKREFRGIFPIKGSDGWGKGYIDRPRARNKDGVYPFRAWVDEIKSKVYSDLQVNERGPGYCHFPEKVVYDSHYFRMLTSERLITSKRSAGHRKLMWELPKGRRNEALDCRCYAVSALTILNPNMEVLHNQGKPLAARSGQSTRRKKPKRISRGVM